MLRHLRAARKALVQEIRRYYEGEQLAPLLKLLAAIEQAIACAEELE